MNYKKITALITAFAACFSALAAPAENSGIAEYTGIYAEGSEAPAVTEEGKLGETVSFTLYENGKMIVKGHGAVTEKATEAVKNYRLITSLEFENDDEGGVTSICERAFDNCAALVEVTVPDSVTKLGDEVFINCGQLQKAVLGNGVTTLVPGLFACCPAFNELTMPAFETECVYNENGGISFDSRTLRVLFTRNDGFYACGLKKVVILDGAETVPDGEFSNIASLNEVVIPQSVKKIGAYAFANCPLQRMVLPDEITEIGDRAFSNCSKMSEINIPGKTEKIGDYAFISCGSLTEITVPDSVTQLGRGAFFECRTVKNAKLGKGIKTIIPELLYGCITLETLEMPDIKTECVYDEDGNLQPESGNIKTMFTRNDGFFMCGLKKAVILDGSEEISDGEFAGITSLEEVVFPASVTKIGANAFETCTLFNIEFPENLESIGERAFSGCSQLRAVSIPESVTAIGDYAFSKCARMGEAVIPEGVENIGRYAFSECSSLTEITIPDSVTKLGEGAFHACGSIKKAVMGKGVTTLVPSLFAVCSKLEELVMPALETENEYDENGELTSASRNVRSMFTRNDGFYSCGLKKVIILDGSETIPENEFSDIGTLTEVVIPSSVKKIGDRAFRHCPLANIVLPEELTEIGKYAFDRCKLTEIKFPEKTEKIGEYAFVDCASLQEVIVPDSVTEIGKGAFHSCGSLKYAKLGKGIKTFVPELFSVCQTLEMIEIPEIKSECVYDEAGNLQPESRNMKTMFTRSDGFFISALKSVIISDGAEIISEDEFSDMNSIQEIFIPDSVKTISDNAFRRCNNIRDLYYEGSEKEWKTVTESAKITLPDKTVYHFGGALPESERCLSPDADCNGTVNIRDLITVRSFLLGKINPEEETVSPDVNGDGKNNSADYICLACLLLSR